VENYGGISLINACYKIYSQTVNETLKTHAEMYPLNARMDSERQIFHRSIVNTKLLIEKGREFNLETHLAFLDYVKAFDRFEET
jgi:hypothetical protein